MKEQYMQYLENLIKTQIPITNHFNFQIEEYENNSIKLSAPLNQNKNDKGMGFAGSIFSIAVLSGWGLLTLKFKEENINPKIALYKGNIVYKKPIQNDFISQCMISEEEWLKLKNHVLDNSTGKIKLKIAIYEAGKDQILAEMEAKFYAWM